MTRAEWQLAYRLAPKPTAQRIAAAGQATDADEFDVPLTLGELRALFVAARGTQIEAAVWELYWVEDLETYFFGG